MNGRGWAYIGATLGGAVSIAANVAHSYVPPKVPDGQPPLPEDWAPAAGAVVGAVFWPVALFVAVEILARVRWPEEKRWWWLRYGGMLPVALVAAVVSYRHLSGLLGFYLEDVVTIRFGPLAVDGLMVMATGALIATSPARGRTDERADNGRHAAVSSVPDTPVELLALADTPDVPVSPAPSEELADPWDRAEPVPGPEPDTNGHRRGRRPAAEVDADDQRVIDQYRTQLEALFEAGRLTHQEVRRECRLSGTRQAQRIVEKYMEVRTSVR